MKRKNIVQALAAIAIVGVLPVGFRLGFSTGTGTARLVSVQEFHEGVTCTWENRSTVPLLASLERSLFVAPIQERQQQGGGNRRTLSPAITEITRSLESRTIGIHTRPYDLRHRSVSW